MGLTFKIELNNKSKKDGTYGVMLRVTQNRKLKRLSLDISIEKKHFNPNANLDRRNWIKASHPSSALLNTNIYNEIEKFLNIKNELNESISSKEVVGILKRKNNTNESQSFIKFIEDDLEKMEGVKYNASRNMKSSLNRFKDFTKSLNYDDLYFREINVELIQNYHEYLKRIRISIKQQESPNNNGKELERVKSPKVQKPLSPNTIQKELERINRYVVKAIQYDKMPSENNPFLKIKKLKRQGDTKDKVRLTLKQLEKIEAIELNRNNLIWHTRNAFLFAVLNGGLRISDILTLKWKNIVVEKIEGNEMFSLKYTMRKTQKKVNTYLIPSAVEILKKYERDDESFIFPFLNNSLDFNDNFFVDKQISSKTALFNKNLKLIGQKTEINGLSSHVSRYSVASIVYENSGSIDEVRNILAHTNNRTSNGYINEVTKKIVSYEAMNKVFDRKK